jgi:hypothetical protein
MAGYSTPIWQERGGGPHTKIKDGEMKTLQSGPKYVKNGLKLAGCYMALLSYPLPYALRTAIPDRHGVFANF